jgi:protein SCO1/2
MTKRKWMIWASVTVGVIWVVLIGAFKWVQADLNRHQVEPEQQQVAGITDFGTVPPFSFADQDGKRFTDGDLRGHVWIADFFYSQCTSACPMLTSKLLLLQKQLPSPKIRFVSFSVDPEHDTPDALKKYAELWQGDESRWRLLSTDPNGLSAVTRGMHVAVAASGDKDNPILHSTLFMLIDQQGTIRGLYDSIDNDALTRLVDDAKAIDGGNVQTAGAVGATGSNSVERGRVLFGSMGCLACHSQVRVAPPLASLYGSAVRLENKKMVWADEAYLHESIVDPNAKVVAGYARTMPSYRSYLTDTQVMDLVAYIESLSTNQPGGHGFITRASTQADAPELLVVVDPVCKMQVSSDPSAPHVTYHGKAYFFCSQHCKDQFLKQPEDYALTKSSP